MCESGEINSYKRNCRWHDPVVIKCGFGVKRFALLSKYKVSFLLQ